MNFENCNIQFHHCKFCIMQPYKMRFKLGKNEDVRVGVLVKICETLDCKLDDIVDIV